MVSAAAANAAKAQLQLDFTLIAAELSVLSAADEAGPIGLGLKLKLLQKDHELTQAYSAARRAEDAATASSTL